MTKQQTKTLDLLEKSSVATRDSLKSLDDKAQSNIRTMSIITGIIGALNLNAIEISLQSQPVLIIAIVLYVIVLFLSFSVLLPRDKAAYPIHPDWRTIHETTNQDSDAYFNTLAAAFEDIYKHNSKLMQKNSLLVKAGQVLISFNVAIIVIVALIS